MMKDTLTITIKGTAWKLIFGLPVKGLFRLPVDYEFEVNFKVDKSTSIEYF
jgi:hypothetical protein